MRSLHASLALLFAELIDGLVGGMPVRSLGVLVRALREIVVSTHT